MGALVTRSGFCALVPVLGSRNILQNHPFGNHPFANPRSISLSNLRALASRAEFSEWPLSPEAWHNKAGRSDFRNQRFKPDTRKMRKALSSYTKQGSEEAPQSENTENADTKTRTMREMRLIGFNVTGFR